MDILPFFKKIVKEHQRDLVANDSVYNAKFNYAINEIKTSRYTWYNFIVLNLFEQFHRVVNIYFVVLLILQYIPQISSLNPTTTLIPIVFVLAITAIKDAVDDFRRHRSDHSVNNRISHILRNGQLVEEKWMNIKVGDIIKLENNNHVTADILLLSSSEEHNLVYIETAELDGETNLKVRQALPNTGDMNDDLRKLSNFKGAVKCETPNNHLHKFTGNLYWGEEAFPLDNEKILLRGCTLRNTEWCFGLVLFAGPDTKLMQNTGKSIMKRTSMEKLMNKLVWLIFAFLLLLAIITAIGNSIWESSTGESFQVYLPWEGFASSAAMSGFLSFWSYIIILNTVVPISLYVSVEFIRLGQSLFINWDQKMYYEKKDLPAVYRTTALNEELGQIEYVFSDKTGTLTQNVMEFNKCTVAGKRYGDVFDEDGNAVYPDEYTSKVDLSYNMYAQEGFQFYDSRLVNAIKNHDENCEEFFRLISICHTVMPDETSDGNLVYQAQSPDEGALVAAARNFGFVFKSRTFDTITIVEMGEAVEYKVLAILDFDNVRKRMSVIVQDPKGKITLYCKGADTVIYERLDAHSDEDMKKITEEHLEAFACDGLRTLCLAKKHLDEDAYNVWKEAHDEANTALEDRDDRLSAVYEEIERDMILLGATAVEDKLQDGVPETIANLAKANIKIWVLTGDKQETAVNIGYSCNMLTDEMKNVFIISGFSSEEVEAKISAAMHEIHASERSNFSTNLHDDDVQFINHTSSEENGQSVSILSGSTDQYGLVINGQSLVYALANDLELKFLELASLCKAVICCRVTPLQKAKVVQLVKCNKKAVTLAIGDGANDVSMIKAAHIGVGISGEEGTQAVLSSDFALGQFRFLERLLLVHGRWSYVRMSKFFGYFFYKNFAFTLVHFWYGFFNGLTAQGIYEPWFVALYNVAYSSFHVLCLAVFDQSAYDDWFVTLYNIAYTSTPIFVLAILDQDLDDDFSVRFPKLYLPGQKNELFNVKIFFVSLFRGILTSLVLFFIPYGAFSTGMASNGMDMTDYHTVSMVISTCLIIVVSLQAALDTSFWTPINHFFIWGSIGIYFVFTFAMHSDGLFQLVPSQFPFVGVSRNAFTHAALWLTLLLVVMICILPVVAIRFAYAVCWPTYAQKILQIQLRERKKEKKMRIKSPDNFANNLKQRFQTKFKIKRRTSRPKSGYAFSHQHGFGDLITSGRMSMRRKNQPPGSDNRTSEIATVSGSPAIESTDQPVMTETYKKINID